MHKTAIRALTLVALVGLAGGGAACNKKNGSGSKGAAPAPTAVLPTPLDNKSVLVIGTKYLAATKTQTATTAAPDAALALFTTTLYPKLKVYCAAGCHVANAFPFASDGAPLAYQTAKKYMTANPDDSKMIQNIKAGHNGVKPEWAAELAPLIKAVAAAVAKQGG